MDILFNQVFWEPCAFKTLKPAARTKGQYTPSDIMSVWASSTDPCQRGNLSSWPMAIPEAQTAWRAGERCLLYFLLLQIWKVNISWIMQDSSFTQQGVQQECPSTSEPSPHNGWLLIGWTGSSDSEAWLSYNLHLGRETYQQIPGLKKWQNNKIFPLKSYRIPKWKDPLPSIHFQG